MYKLFKKNQKGTAVLVILAVVALLAAATAGYLIWRMNHSKPYVAPADASKLPPPPESAQ